MIVPMQSTIQSQGSNPIIDQGTQARASALDCEKQSVSDFQSDFGARRARRHVVRLWRVYRYVPLLRQRLTPRNIGIGSVLPALLDA